MKKSVITIGFFDGVHLGHRKLIATAIDEARRSGFKAVLLTFDRHTKKNMLLTPINEKLKLLKLFKLDEIDVVEFTQKFADMSAESFVEKYLVKKHNMGKLITGYDFKFGKDRQGDKPLLGKLAKKYGYNLISVGPVAVTDRKTGKKIIVSSSYIRECISRGNIKFANELLCGHYSTDGKIVKGGGIGAKLGFPTANIETQNNKLLPMGVFAGYVLIDGKPHAAAANIGYNPTVTDKHEIRFEVHVINFKASFKPGDILRFYFTDKLRDEKKFKDLEELKKQIKKDIKKLLKEEEKC
ncbi:MAG: bifunctional riboflavin kinase/FAD synthetase [Elusimicrobia bacterium]|nr:bifunctional riboflavin kinase/FAD synthetase [Elusimicrobiota bacterium]MBU2615335.1 bifunctional riboflavin kinase/FAD synthetase [Elusimicrobiota bacterium]